MMSAEPLERQLRQERESGVFSAAAYEIGDQAGYLARNTIGTIAWDGTDARQDTPFDIASVTKPIAGLLAMVLLESGCLRLDDPIGRYLPAYAASDKAGITIGQLLTHTSGIPGQQPLYRTAATPSAMHSAIQRLPLRHRPGHGVIYSSQGFIILGRVLEIAAGKSLRSCLSKLVLRPLGMSATSYGLAPGAQETAAATEFCQWRGRLIQGTVHDENAHVLGGCAAHAGLFSTAADLGRLCRMMLRGGASDSGQLLAERTIATMTAPRTDHLALRRSLAWQGRDAQACPAGTMVSGSSYGHTGFTGTSVWIDPELGRYVVLLTNAVHPRRAPERMRAVRPRLHDLAIPATAPIPPERNVAP